MSATLGTAQMIRDAVREGRLSAEQGATLLELHYDLRRIARRARFKRWLWGVLLAPLRWLGLTRLQ